MTKKSEQAEVDFVRRLARSLAVANGHSHPDEYAESVVAAHTADDQASSSGDAGESGAQE